MTENWRNVIQQVRSREAEAQRQWKLRRKKNDEESQERIEQAQSLMFPCLRPATVEDYRTWLEGYIKAGKEPTHSYDYLFPKHMFYVATHDFSTVSLYGSQSVSIIIPRGISVDLSRGKGHTDLFYMDGFKTGGTWVPIYSDL